MHNHPGEYARFLAYGNQLIAIHADLRDRLADLREGVVPDRDLGAHCLAFCAAVTRHHTGEDASVFPVLAARHPELREFLAALVRDHHVIAGLLAGVSAAAGRLSGEADRERVTWIQRELDGLAAILETHFIGEEKRLVAVLNAIDPSVGLTGLAG
ncbi:hemerythrin domain-containing protein [Actinoplanes sp. NPDC049118]|uniref:hemerythrin domain-containing protein n=1 Tax=Actinoplanes sp. NPDC049118 TaxID=3155769 RepID=UPI003404820F